MWEEFFLTQPEDSGASERNERGRNLGEVTCAVTYADTDSLINRACHLGMFAECVLDARSSLRC